MIDIKFIRENPDKVQKAARDKGIDVNVNHVLEIDAKYRELSNEVQLLREERNKYAKAASNAIDKEKVDIIEKGKELKTKLEILEKALSALQGELKEWLYKIPNPASKDVKIGKDESENEVIKKHGKPHKFSFTPKDHLDLGEALDVIDVKRAAKVSGTRFAYLKTKEYYWSLR